MFQKGNLANKFRPLANTGFNKIQMVAKACRGFNPGLGLPPLGRSSHHRQLWPGQGMFQTENKQSQEV